MDRKYINEDEKKHLEFFRNEMGDNLEQWFNLLQCFLYRRINNYDTLEFSEYRTICAAIAHLKFRASENKKNIRVIDRTKNNRKSENLYYRKNTNFVGD